MKKEYRKPALKVHGDVETLTQKGGNGFVDVPLGTPNTGPGSVTS